MDRQTGMIVAPRDSATLARRIEELLGDAALRHTLGSNAHRLVAEHYSIDRMLDRVEQIYRKVLSQN
jgi:glycosyltransferase involved in cell wall biosynthesis